jgi:chorismate--pyruvate lyase
MTDKAGMFTGVVRSVWRPARRVMRTSIPQKLAPWLLSVNSLTDSVVASCTGHFRILVVAQAWGRPSRSEARMLDIHPQRLVWTRQVYLLCDDVPWVYARSIVPPRTLTGRTRRLTQLRARSLGSILFSDPSMARGEFQIACFEAGDPIHASATRMLASAPQAVWGRRAVYTLSGKPLLVSEVFLPAIGAFPT